MYAVIVEGHGEFPKFVTFDLDDYKDLISFSYQAAEELKQEMSRLYPDLNYVIVKLESNFSFEDSKKEELYNKEDVISILKSIGKTEVKDFLPVRDGYVVRDSKVWWHAESGPQQVTAGVALVSGASPAVVKSVLGGTLSPLQVMLDTVMIDRYNLV